MCRPAPVIPRQGLARFIAPSACDARAMLVTEMTLHMQDVAKDAAYNDLLEFPHGGKTTLVVAEAKDHARVPTGSNRAFGLAARKSQWLFAPDRLADARHLNNLIHVQ